MNKIALLFLGLICFSSVLKAQTFTKEASNFLALYNQTKDFSQLEKAKKNIDDGYKLKKDSITHRNNLLRAMIYSTLAFADSSRKLSYKKDPIDEALFALNNLKDQKFNDEYAPEINFVHKQLANAYIKKANKRLKDNDFKGAYDSYRGADSLTEDDLVIKHNMALLSDRLGFTQQAIGYYEYLINAKKPSPEYYLSLFNLYEKSGDSNKSLKVLQNGRAAFPKNKDLLFREINLYSDNKKYNGVTSLVDEAINVDPSNSELYYLAGYSYDMMGNYSIAERYYKKILELAPNSYKGNYALGLLYLSSYFNAKEPKRELLSNAKNYLLKAQATNPYSDNVLKSLAILYKTTGETLELDSIKNKLNLLQ